MYTSSLSPVSEQEIPVIRQFDNTPPADFIAWYALHKEQVEQALLRHGAVLFRGIDIDALEKFSRITQAMSDTFINYVDGFSPRTKLSSNVYTSTEYDSDFYITLHSELSYSARWPAKILFCCLVPPGVGGETPIADCRRILQSMSPSIVREFEKRGVRYVRNLHGGGGPGPSWQDTFETKDPAAVEAFCRQSNTEFRWNGNGGLKLTQYRAATLAHPVTGERVWFNQVDQFHPCHFEEEIYETLMMLYDGVEEDLPMFGSYGDDTPIPREVIHEVRRTVDAQAVARPWQQGDLLVLDNVLMCHGRMPFKGERKILVSMY